MAENYPAEDRAHSFLYVGVGYPGAGDFAVLAGGDKVRGSATGDTADQVEIQQQNLVGDGTTLYIASASRLHSGGEHCHS